MKLGLIGAGVVLGLGFTLGGAATFVNAQSGDPNMARNSIHYGIGSAAGMVGEAAGVVPQVVDQVKPALSSLASQTQGVLGGVTTTVPSSSDRVDPAQTGGQ